MLRSASPSANPRPIQAIRRDPRFHHASLVPAARHGLLPSRVPRPAGRDRRPADQRGPRRSGRALRGARRDAMNNSRACHGPRTSRRSRPRARRAALTISIPIPRSIRIRSSAARARRRRRRAGHRSRHARRNATPRSARCARRAITPNARRAMGFCIFNNVAVGVDARDRGARRRARRPSSTSTSTTATAPRRSSPGDPRVRDGRHVPASALSVLGLRERRVEHAQRAAVGRQRRRRLPRAAVVDHWLPALDAHRPEILFISAGIRRAPRGSAREPQVHRSRLRMGHAQLMWSRAATRKAASSPRSRAVIRSRRWGAASRYTFAHWPGSDDVLRAPVHSTPPADKPVLKRRGLARRRRRPTRRGTPWLTIPIRS